MTEYAGTAILMLGQGDGPPHPAVLVGVDNPIPVSVAGLPLPSGGATSALQGTGNTSLATIATNTTGLATAAGQTASGTILGNILTKLGAVVLSAGSAVIGGVTQSGSWVLSAGSAVIGGVTQSGNWVLSAGSALIGKVGIDQTTFGTTNLVASKPIIVTPVDRSIASTAASTATAFVGANASRNTVTFQVPTALTNGLWLSWTGAAGNGTAGSYFFPSGIPLVSLDVSVIGTGALSYWTSTGGVVIPVSEG